MEGTNSFFLNALLLIKFLFYKKSDFNLVYTNSSVTPFGFYLSLLLGLPHIWHIREYGKEDYGLKYDFGKKYFKWALSKSNHIICISNDLFQRKLNPLDTNYSIVFNGICTLEQLEKNHAEYQKGEFSEDDFNISIVGMLREEKGQHQAISALSKVNNPESLSLQLNIIGDGQEKYTRYLKELVQEYELGSMVNFTGYVDDPEKYYKKSQIVLMCSQNEALGRVTLEAMSYGNIVIGRNSGATKDIIEDGKNGFLYNGSIAGLASRIEYVYENFEKLKGVQDNAFSTVKDHYLIEDYINNIGSIIEGYKNVK